jgi:hypothetical protein
MTDEEIEDAADRAFIKLFGRTYRPNEKLPAEAGLIGCEREPDTLDKIVADFPSLFGQSKS